MTQPGAPFIGDLDAVSCSSSSACTATGYYLTGWAPLIERWSGTHLTLQQAAAPPGNGPFTGVSCPDSDDCIAVGDVGISPPFTSPPYIEAWDGTAWSVMTSPAAAGELVGVSCTAVTACTAIGSTVGSTRGMQGSVLTERLSGLSGVSCVSATSCIAVGSTSATQPLAYAWNGTGWTRMTLPAGGGYLSGVSCTSATWCVAVGANGYGGGVTWVADAWDGTTWTPMPTSGDLGISAVSCSSSVACTAVGSLGYDPDETPVIERWDGTAWTAQTPASPPAGDKHAQLDGVSCASATACAAVGYYRAAGPRGRKHYNRQAFIQAWDGATWTAEQAPAFGTSGLASVSCTAPASCTAVGFRKVQRRWGPHPVPNHQHRRPHLHQLTPPVNPWLLGRHVR